MSLGADVELQLRLSHRDSDVDFHAYCGVTFANETERAVFVGGSGALLCRCDSESATAFAEVDAAIWAIPGADRC